MNAPIRIHLAVTYCVIFWISTILLELGAYASLKLSINAVVDSELLMRYEGVVGFLDEHVSRKTLKQLRSELLAHGALNPEFLQIDQDGGFPIHKGGSMIGIDGGSPTFEPQMMLRTNRVNMPVRVLLARCIVRNRTYTLTLGDNFTLPSKILRHFEWLAVLSSPIILACAALVGYWVSKRALEPVSRLTRTARQIGASNLNERVPVSQSGDELQDLAETLNEMLSRIEGAFRHVTQFTANASHELRTPLALIRATAEVTLLRVNGSAEYYAEALHRILREAEKNTNLLDDMLHLARADASVDLLTFKEIDFQSHIEDIWERALPLATEKGIRLVCSQAQAGVTVMADPEHLRRLWLILLGNAIRYTPHGGTIQICWYAVTPACLACEIRDTGIGISEADLPHVFERFFRVDKARSREEGGAGLGLALAKWIVEAHRAKIEVESVLGEGSTFRVVLPGANHLNATPVQALLAGLKCSLIRLTCR